MSLETKITDIYDGEYINIWHDSDDVFITIAPNAITFSLPIASLPDLFAEFAKAQTAWQAINDFPRN